MRVRAWYAVVPAFIAVAVAANVPGGCQSTGRLALNLVSCSPTVEYADVQYEAHPIDLPVARRYLMPARAAVEPGCSDFGTVTDCGVVYNRDPDQPTEVRPVRGLDRKHLLVGEGDRLQPHIVLVPFDSETGWMLTAQARRFIDRHSDQPLPADYGVVPGR